MTRRLAVLTPCLGAPSETFIRRHVNDLTASTTAVYLYEPDGGRHWNAEYDSFNPADDLTLAAKAVAKLKGQHEAFQRPAVRARLIQELQHRKIDVVLAEYLDYWLPVLEDLQRSGIEVWGHAHGYDVSQALRDPKMREAYRAWNEAAGVITMAHHTVERLVSCGISRQRIHVVNYGVDIPSGYGPRPLGPARFVAVGRLVAKKDPVSLVRAFGLLDSNDSTLTIVGSGPLESEVEHEVASLDYPDRISLMGALQNQEVLSEMRQANVFVQHSRVDPETGDEEGLPVAVLEAMSVGLPVVATRHAGIPDAVVDGVTGFLVDEGDVESMAKRMATLAAEPELRAEMGRAGYRRLREHFTWKRERSELRSLLGLDR